MGFFRLLKSSVYDPSFYARVGQKKASSAFGYFALLMLLNAVIFSITPIREFSKFAFQSSKEREALRDQIADIYPDELRLTFDNGTISTNVEEPYGIPFPEAGIPNDSSAEEYPDYLIVIDTENPISEASFRDYGAMAILGKNSIGFYDPEKGKVEIQDLSDMSEGSFSLDKKTYESFLYTLGDILYWIGVAFLLVVPFMIFLGILPMSLLYLLFGALIIWLVAKIRGADWGYGTSYKAGLYLMTLPIAYSLISSQALFPELSVPFLFTGILAIVTFVNAPKRLSTTSIQEVAADEPVIPKP